MIRIVVYRDQASRLTGFMAQGHSGYAEEGSDIVCSAVSVLTINCINSIEALCGVTPTVKGGEDGYLKASIPFIANEETSRSVQLLLRSLELGLRSLAEEWSEYVNLSIQERRETP